MPVPAASPEAELMCSHRPCLRAATLANISAILFAVRNFLCFAGIAILGGFLVCLRSDSRALAPSREPPSAQSTSPQPGQAAPAPSPLTPQQAPPPAVRPAPTIVLDPAHGGTDSGARGEAGTLEKDVVLAYARVVRGELEHQGFRVVLTRDGDSNPSYDDRAALANAYRDAVFISLHVSSTGASGAAHVYYYRFGSNPSPFPAAVKAAPRGLSPATSLVPWEEAQLPHLEASHRLADRLQGELAQRFGGSPTTAAAVAVRGLRSVNAPAVAIELSSVSAPDPGSLVAMALPLAASISHGLQAFRGAGSTGGN
jgi:N-acetylmuramoyl-L-alanine amidase